MDLERFLRTSGWTEEQLAGPAGVDQSTINKLRRRRRKASLELALRIEDATGGRVPAEEVPMTKTTRQSLKSLRARGLTALSEGSAA